MSKKILLVTTVIIGLTAIFGITKNQYAQGQTGLNLTISPTVLDLTANPGDTLKEKFRVRNNGSSPVDLVILVDKLDPHARNGEVVPIKPDPNDPSISWISFETATITAKPKEWIDIPFTIAVPKTASFGYYYAFRIGPGKASTQQNVPGTQLLGQIVLPVLLNVQANNAKAELKLISFTTNAFLNEYLPVTFQTTFTNSGNIHIKPSGTIFVRLSDGTSTALDVNPGSGTILPGGKRTYETNWTDGFLVQQVILEDGSPKLDKNGKPMYQLTINWDRLTHFRIGKYTATLLAVYDNGQKDEPLEATTTFWVIPYTLIGVSVIGLIIVIVILRFLLRWYIAKELKKRQK